MTTHAVFFEVRPAGEAGRRAYLAQALALTTDLRGMPGFVTIERFESVMQPGWLLSLSIWHDEASLIRWRENLKHRAAQERGRREIFEDYRIRVAREEPRLGNLTLVEGGSPAGRNFDSLQVQGHRVALIEGAGEHSSGTRWQVLRDYGMHDRHEAPAPSAATVSLP
jgi:heme-degrading monooxygenase HmoA